MPAIWFSGWLDHLYTLNPVRLRGYDDAGNLLWSVRGNDIRAHDYLSLANASGAERGDFRDPYFFAPGFDHYGNPKTLVAAGFASGIPHPREQAISQFAAGRNGRLYCALAPSLSARALKSGTTEGQVRDVRQQISVQPGLSAYHMLTQSITVPAGDPELGWDDLTVYPYQPHVEGLNGEPYYVDLYHRFFSVYRPAGDRISHPELHGRPVYAVAANDAEGGFYLAGEPVGAGETYLRKYTDDFVQVWAAPIARWWPVIPYYTPPQGFGTEGYYTQTRERTVSIVLDAAGDLYVAGHYESINWATWAWPNKPASRSGWLRKHSGATGAMLWERRFDSGVSNCATDGTKIYIATRQLARQYKIGASASYFRADQEPVDISIWDAIGNLTGTISTPYTVTTYPTGPESITRNGGVLEPLRLVVSGGRLYVSHESTAYTTSANNPKCLFVYDTSTLLEVGRVPPLTDNHYLLARNPNLNFTDFAFDAAGNQYFPRIGADLTTLHFMAFSPAGVRLWEPKTGDGLAQANSSTGAWDGLGIRVVEDPYMPALPLDLRLGTPSRAGDSYVLLPGLPLVFGLGTPSLVREYVGPLRPVVYRLLLNLAPPVELKFSSLTLRRTAAGGQLSAVASAPNLTTLQLIDLNPGVSISIMRGVLLPSGIEQADEMLALPLTAMRADIGPKRFSVTLEGRGEETAEPARTRALKGISYRALIDGRRRVRCEIDPLIKPGDIANLGAGETIIVGEVTITLGTGSALMEVAEA